MSHDGYQRMDDEDEDPFSSAARPLPLVTQFEPSEDADSSNDRSFSAPRSRPGRAESSSEDIDVEISLADSSEDEGNESDSPRGFGAGNCVVKNTSHAVKGKNSAFFNNLNPPLQTSSENPSTATSPSGDDKDPETPHTHALAVVHSHTKTGLFMTTWNLFNDVLSCGVVAFPFYISESGMGAGVILLLLYAVMCDSTLLILYDLANKHNLTSFAHMSHVAGGNPGYVVASIMMFVFNWGGYVGNIIVMGNILPDLLIGIFGYHPILQRKYLLVFAVVAFAPLAYKKSLARFAIASALSVWALIFLCLLVIARYFVDREHFSLPPTPHSKAFIHSNVLPALGGFAMMYTCQDMFFHVFHSLHRPTKKRVAVVAHSIMFGMCGLAMAVGLCGYLMFYDNVEQNILDSFGTRDIPTQVARALLVFNVVISVPYTNYIPRVAIQAVIQMYRPELVVKQTNPSNKTVRTVIHATITTVLLGSGLLVAEFVTDLGVVFELVGGFSAVGISLIIPAFCYLRLEPDGPRSMRIWCYIVLLCGLIGMVGCVSTVILSL